MPSEPREVVPEFEIAWNPSDIYVLAEPTRAEVWRERLINWAYYGAWVLLAALIVLAGVLAR